MRINRYIASCGLCSRRGADSLIEEGRVKINGSTASLTSEVAEGDRVEVDGKGIGKEEKVYIALHKPAGYLTANSDERERTVIELINIKERVFPIGRLDLDSEGLLLLTNDGEIYNKIIHPRSEIWKKYYVECEEEILDSDIQRLERGFTGEYKTLPCKVERLGKRRAYVSIREGQKRQIKVMFELVENRVTYLRRVSIGKLELGDLKRGEWRYLTEEELSYLESLK